VRAYRRNRAISLDDWAVARRIPTESVPEEHGVSGLDVTSVQLRLQPASLRLSAEWLMASSRCKHKTYTQKSEYSRDLGGTLGGLWLFPRNRRRGARRIACGRSNELLPTAIRTCGASPSSKAHLPKPDVGGRISVSCSVLCGFVGTQFRQRMKRRQSGTQPAENTVVFKRDLAGYTRLFLCSGTRGYVQSCWPGQIVDALDTLQRCPL
jgi:hypothetical protein